MKKQIFYSSTCSTNSKIIKQLGDISSFEKINIKTENITIDQLEELKTLIHGDYSDFFSRRAIKYRTMNLKDKDLSEKDIADLITSEYTFLKRPVIRMGDKVFIGSGKNMVQSAIDYKSSLEN